MAEVTLSPEETKKKRKTIQDYEYLGNSTGPVEFTSDFVLESYDKTLKVREKETNDIYALKILSKKSLAPYPKKQIKDEVKTYKTIYHPHITRLLKYFEDAEAIYLVFEFVEQGSLSQWLKKKKQLEENMAFVSFFQTCLAVDYLHKRQIFHGDLTSKNLLLDSDLNIKLSGFVLTNKNDNCRTFNYVSPEMKTTFYPSGSSLDIWYLGILLYELLHKFVPFKGRNLRERVQDMSSKPSVYFSPNLSLEVVDLIKKMIVPVSSEIICLEEIFQHPWMRKHMSDFKIDLKAMMKQQDEVISQVDPDFIPPTAANSGSNSPELEEEKEEKEEKKIENKPSPVNVALKNDSDDDYEDIDEEEEEKGDKEEERRSTITSKPLITEREEEEEPDWWWKILHSFGCTSRKIKEV